METTNKVFQQYNRTPQWH